MKLAAALVALAALAAHAAVTPPLSSRVPEKGCAWKRLESVQLGLAVSYQRCDFGYRVIDFLTISGKPSLYLSMEDTGKKASLDPVVTVYDKKAEEGPDEAVRRIALKGLSRYKRKHCVVVAKYLSYLGPGKAAFTLSPDKQYGAELEKTANGEIPDPPCGDLGELADGLTYFEFHPVENPRRFLFVSAGQDTPLFDESRLMLLP